MATQRVLTSQEASPADEQANWSLRPQSLDEFVGQPELVERLRIAIEAAKGRNEPMEHVLLDGPPGLGKTTMAHVIAQEMGTRVHATSGPALTRPSDLVGALTKLQHGDLLFIDEIHRLPAPVEEFIYPAMEDFRIDVALDSGMHARTVSLTLKPFTLIGATTRAGLLTAPLRSRFGITHHLRYYALEDLRTILERSARLLGLSMNGEALDALELIGARSRGAPRVANRLLRRVRDYAQVRAGGAVSRRAVEEALALEGVDAQGLDDLDRAYLAAIARTYAGGPVGIEAIAATMGEDAGSLEDVVEPFLLQAGLLARTRRGRALTPAGAKRMNVAPPSAEGLFAGES